MKLVGQDRCNNPPSTALASLPRSPGRGPIWKSRNADFSVTQPCLVYCFPHLLFCPSPLFNMFCFNQALLISCFLEKALFPRVRCYNEHSQASTQMTSFDSEVPMKHLACFNPDSLSNTQQFQVMTALCSSFLCFDFQGMGSFWTQFWNNLVAPTSICAVTEPPEATGAWRHVETV